MYPRLSIESFRENIKHPPWHVSADRKHEILNHTVLSVHSITDSTRTICRCDCKLYLHLVLLNAITVSQMELNSTKCIISLSSLVPPLAAAHVIVDPEGDAFPQSGRFPGDGGLKIPRTGKGPILSNAVYIVPPRHPMLNYFS